MDVQSYFVARRKSIKRLWKLPNTTHCSLLPHINDCISWNLFLSNVVQSLSSHAPRDLIQLLKLL